MDSTQNNESEDKTKLPPECERPLSAGDRLREAKRRGIPPTVLAAILAAEDADKKKNQTP